jgi:hypothetical protein
MAAGRVVAMAKKYRVMITALIQKTVEVEILDSSEDPEYDAEQTAQAKLELQLGTPLNDVQDVQVEEI